MTGTEQFGAPVPLPDATASSEELTRAALDVLALVGPLLPDDIKVRGFASPSVTLTRMMDTLLRAVQHRERLLGWRE